MNTPETTAANMLLREIPQGAHITVTLRNGKQFCGYEDTRDDDRARGLLRIRAELSDAEAIIFTTTADQLSCFEMVCLS